MPTLESAQPPRPSILAGPPLGLAIAAIAILSVLAAATPLSMNLFHQSRAHQTQQSTRINLNAASAAELQLIPSIGPKRAEDIVAYRDRIAGFRHPSQLQRISGIGPRTAETILRYAEIPDTP